MTSRPSLLMVPQHLSSSVPVSKNCCRRSEALARGSGPQVTAVPWTEEPPAQAENAASALIPQKQLSRDLVSFSELFFFQQGSKQQELRRKPSDHTDDVVL